MKALVITYDGPEISNVLIDQFMMSIHAPERNCAVCCHFDDNETAKMLVAAANVQPETQEISAEQEAVNNAATYIARKVLSKTSDPLQATVIIANSICCGDTAMRNAVEILATKQGEISEKGFTKPILSMIKKLHQAYNKTGFFN